MISLGINRRSEPAPQPWSTEFLQLLDDNEALFWVCVAAFIALVWIAWPIFPMFMAALVLWLHLNGRGSPWSKATRGLLLPVLCGLAILTVCLLFFYLWGWMIRAEELRTAEVALIKLRIALAKHIALPWPLCVAVLTALFAISHVVPQRRVVTRFVLARRIASTVVMILTTVTTFTFFSNIPLHRMIGAEHARRVEECNANVGRLRVLLREDWNNVAQYLALQAVEQEIRGMGDEQKDDFRRFFYRIDTIARNTPLEPPPRDGIEALIQARESNEDRIRRTQELILSRQKQAWNTPERLVVDTIDLRVEVTRRAGERDAEKTRQEPAMQAWSQRFATDADIDQEIARRELQASLLEAVPNSATEWDEQRQLLAAQEEQIRKQASAVQESRIRSEEKLTAVTKAFSQTVGLLVPDLEGLCGAYLKALIGGYSEHIFKSVVEWSRARAHAVRREEVNVASAVIIPPNFTLPGHHFESSPNDQAADAQAVDAARELVRYAAEASVRAREEKMQLEILRTQGAERGFADVTKDPREIERLRERARARFRGK